MSAKSGDGVKAMFEALSKKLIEQFNWNKTQNSREDRGPEIRITSTARHSPEECLCCTVC